jgi:uncharacterized membrane protein YdbT with pleckstrin-like domain
MPFSLMTGRIKDRIVTTFPFLFVEAPNVGYVEKHLLAGETVAYTTKLHWSVLLWHAVFAALFGLSAIALLAGGLGDRSSDSSSPRIYAGAALLVLSVVLIGAGILKRNATEMAVTNKRVLIKMGVLSRKTFEMLFSKIESIGVEEPVLGRLFGYGTVTIRGVGGTPDLFPRIAHPLEFRKQVQQQIENSPTATAK